MSEVALIIEEQFFKGSAGDVGEVELRLGTRGSQPVALGDVLSPAASCLNHLVVGAGASIKVTIAEGDGAIVDEGSDLEAAEGTVPAARAKLSRRHGRSVMGLGWVWEGSV